MLNTLIKVFGSMYLNGNLYSFDALILKTKDLPIVSSCM